MWRWTRQIHRMDLKRARKSETRRPEGRISKRERRKACEMRGWDFCRLLSFVPKRKGRKRKGGIGEKPREIAKKRKR